MVSLVSMLQGNNPIQFFENLEDTRFKNADILDFIVIYQNSKIPPFSVIHVTEETTASIILRDENNEEIVTIGGLIVEDQGDAKSITFVGADSAGNDDGCYYIELIIGTEHFYSEFFSWKTDLYKFLGFEIASADITIGNKYKLPLSLFTNNFYLQYNGISIESEINEDGVEKPWGDIPSFSTSNIRRKANINGTDQIFRMLSSIRPIKVNADVNIKIKGIKYSIYDTNVEIADDNTFGESMIIDFSYKESDFISTRNEI